MVLIAGMKRIFRRLGQNPAPRATNSSAGSAATVGDGTPDPELQAVLRRNAVLTQSWGGEHLDAEGSVHLAGGDSAVTPVYWCFNAETEFPQLAQALGPERPLAGMRSLHRVTDEANVNSGLAQQVADHYATHLLRRFGPSPCIVGGNCQSASIAYRVALHLLTQGVPVVRLVTLDAELRFPYPGHVRKLFGRHSELYNPFIASRPDPGLPPCRNWRFAYRNAEWSELDGRHGAYFQPGNVDRLAEAIMKPHRISSLTAGNPAPRTAAETVTWRILHATPEHVTIGAPRPTGPEPLALLPVWRKADGSVFRVGDDAWLQPAPATGDWTCQIPRPGTPGPWTLRTVLCGLDQGPLRWPVDGFQSLDID